MNLNFIWLTVSSFCIGALPLSLYVGFLLLHKDIRRFGDGNPGAVNVFRAGNPTAGMLAVLLDIGKGVPSVYVASHLLHLPENQLLFIGMAAILGHAFSPFLRLKGGKAVAVTFGVLIGLGRPEMLFPFCITSLAGFLILDNHSWVVLCAPVVTLLFLFKQDASSVAILFMSGILFLYIIKQFRNINGWPHLSAWLYRWLQSRRQA
jgi:glycerol-3-phosphate acyltransferase PlsY